MKRTVTSVFVGIMALLLLVTGFGCGKKAAPKIAVMLPETGSGISEETAAAVEEALFAVSGNDAVEYLFRQSSDAAEQLAFIDMAKGWRALAVVIVPTEGADTEEMKKIAEEKNITLYLAGFESVESTLAQAGEEAGKFAVGELVKVKQPSCLALVSDENAEAYNAFETTAGSLDCIRIDVEADREAAREAVSKWLADHDKDTVAAVAAVFADSDEAALGAMDAFNEYDRKIGLRLVVGIGGRLFDYTAHELDGIKVASVAAAEAEDSIFAAIQLACEKALGGDAVELENINLLIRKK